MMMKVIACILSLVLLTGISSIPVGSEDASPAVPQVEGTGTEATGEAEEVFYYNNGIEIALTFDEGSDQGMIESIADMFVENLMSEDFYPECVDGGPHTLKNVTVTKTEHCVYTEAPRCLEEKYRFTYCAREGCYHMECKPLSSSRVSCHSGNVKRDREVYENYLYYDNADSHKKSGYVTDHVTLIITRDYLSNNGYPTASSFFGVSDRICAIEYPGSNVVTIRLSRRSGATDGAYTEEEIDSFIGIMDQIDALYFVGYVEPGHKTEYYAPEETPDRDTETDAETASPEPDETGNPNTEDAPDLPDDEDDARVTDDTVFALDADETVSEEVVNALHNPQTGDGVFVYLMLFSLICCAAAFLWRRARRGMKSDNDQ
ncbi:MAG: hypothetical protein IJQ80_02850 [Clostridia bacterium]|nr:hypothetical protein [Clostridia bacterium]